MDYKGKLYGKVGDVFFETGKTADDWDNLEKKLENTPHPIKFGRWLLKYAKEKWDDGLLCWEYQGKCYNTDELYEIFSNE